jgi:hypothetical protein
MRSRMNESGSASASVNVSLRVRAKHPERRSINEAMVAIYCSSPAGTDTDTFPVRADNSDLEGIRRVARLAV